MIVPYRRKDDVNATMDKLYNQLKEIIIQAKSKENQTQDEFAYKVYVSRDTIQRLECTKGKKNKISWEKLIWIAVALGVPILDPSEQTAQDRLTLARKMREVADEIENLQ